MKEKAAEKRMAENVLEPIEKKGNRTAKDSVFVDLFERPEYLIQLYRILHPEERSESIRQQGHRTAEA